MPSSIYNLRPADYRWGYGDFVRKKKGSAWHGKVVGLYSTDLTPIGYAVESAFEAGSVQIYPEAALETWERGAGLSCKKCTEVGCLADSARDDK